MRILPVARDNTALYVGMGPVGKHVQCIGDVRKQQGKEIELVERVPLTLCLLDSLHPHGCLDCLVEYFGGI